MNRQALFSYGTLQDKTVQQELFGRKLNGDEDLLEGYIKNKIELLREDFTKVEYPVIEYTGKKEHTVNGIVYLISDQKLKITDIYEGSAYKRIEVTLASGKQAWTYVKSSFQK